MENIESATLRESISISFLFSHDFQAMFARDGVWILTCSGTEAGYPHRTDGSTSLA